MRERSSSGISRKVRIRLFPKTLHNPVNSQTNCSLLSPTVLNASGFPDKVCLCLHTLLKDVRLIRFLLATENWVHGQERKGGQQVGPEVRRPEEQAALLQEGECGCSCSSPFKPLFTLIHSVRPITGQGGARFHSVEKHQDHPGLLKIRQTVLSSVAGRHR